MQDSFVPTAQADEINCSEVNFTEMEKAGLEIVSQVNDLVMNVDITEMQYDVYMLVENGQKLGLDQSDFFEYGDAKDTSCGR